MVTSFNRKKVMYMLLNIILFAIGLFIGSGVGVLIMCMMSLASEADSHLYGGKWDGNKDNRATNEN